VNSRYTFMKPGSVTDEDGSAFPDPLTLNYNNFVASETLTPIELTEVGIQYFWREVGLIYGTPELDDVVLTLNGIPHINFLDDEDIILVPSQNDIINSYRIR